MPSPSLPLCTKCGAHPRYVTPSGHGYPLCLPCRREAHKRWREQHRARELAGVGDVEREASGKASSELAQWVLTEVSSEALSEPIGETIRASEGERIEPASMRPCSRCGIRPRHVSPLSGRRYTTCQECKRADNTAWRKASRARMREALEASPTASPTASEGAVQVATEDASPLGAAPPVGEPGRDDPRDDPPASPGRELAPVELADAPALTPEDTGERIPRASDIPGVLADMLLLLDRSRAAIGRGEIDALRLAVDVRGVRVHMGTESIERDGRGREDD